MGWWENYKPVVAMLGLQLCYAGLAVSTRFALLQGTSPRVFVVYRQAIATLVIAPIAYFSHGYVYFLSLTFTLFMIFDKQMILYMQERQAKKFLFIRIEEFLFDLCCFFDWSYNESEHIFRRIVHGIFIHSKCNGLEKVDIRSVRSMAKILGTVVCVVGAVCMTLLKGPKLLNIEFTHHNSIFLNSLSSGGENWLLGCLLLFGSCCCWSFWLILQVPMSASYPNNLSLTAWMCFFSTLQSATLTFFLEPNSQGWYLHSTYELSCVLYAGVIGSALAFFIQGWCISQRGPLFSAMFNPLGTVIVVIFAGIVLHEELYTGSVVGALAVVLGLYTVLWGKAKDIQKINTDSSDEDPKKVLEKLLIDNESKLDEDSCKIDLEEPLLIKCSSYVNENNSIIKH